MRIAALSILVLLFSCGDDSSPSGEGSGVTGLWAWCDDDACDSLDDGGLVFSGGKVLDASYDADASTYCTYEQVGSYEVNGTSVVISAEITTDAGVSASADEKYTIDGSLLRGSHDLKRVQATKAEAASCPH